MSHDFSSVAMRERNLEQMAAYLRDMLQDRLANGGDVTLLAEALDSIERTLHSSYLTESRKLPAA
jgi:hypothetical protein